MSLIIHKYKISKGGIFNQKSIKELKGIIYNTLSNRINLFNRKGITISIKKCNIRITTKLIDKMYEIHLNREKTELIWSYSQLKIEGIPIEKIIRTIDYGSLNNHPQNIFNLSYNQIIDIYRKRLISELNSF